MFWVEKYEGTGVIGRGGRTESFTVRVGKSTYPVLTNSVGTAETKVVLSTD